MYCFSSMPQISRSGCHVALPCISMHPNVSDFRAFIQCLPRPTTMTQCLWIEKITRTGTRVSCHMSLRTNALPWTKHNNVSFYINSFTFAWRVDVFAFCFNCWHYLNVILVKVTPIITLQTIFWCCFRCIILGIFTMFKVKFFVKAIFLSLSLSMIMTAALKALLSHIRSKEFVGVTISGTI